MLSESKALEAKYRNSHPGFTLVSIEKIAIPVADVEFDLNVEEIKPLPTVTEFILRFVSLGLVSVAELSEALGLNQTQVTEAIAKEVESGRLGVSGKGDNVILTDLGNEALSTLLSITPKRAQTKILVEKSTMKMVDWPNSEFVSQKQLNSDGFDGMLLKPDSRKNLRSLSFKSSEVDKIVRDKNTGPKRLNVLGVVGKKPKAHGYVLGNLLIKVGPSGRASEVIDVLGSRQEHLESEFIRQGLEANFNFEGFGGNSESDAKKLLETIREYEQTSEVHPVENESPAPDGGYLETYQHAAIFQEALNTATRRLVIVSPWISDQVVNTNFLQRLESLLRAKVQVIVAWHFRDENRPDDKGKDSPKAVRSLLTLSERYKSFLFIKLERSHAKVLLFDDTYVATSFNWLSFRGARGGKYRLELGEMRTHPSVVDDRFARLQREFTLLGHPTTKHDIPN